MTEKEIFDKVDCKITGGTKIKNIVDFFRNNNYIVETSIEHEKNINGKCFEIMEEFRDFIIKNLKKRLSNISRKCLLWWTLSSNNWL